MDNTEVESNGTTYNEKIMDNNNGGGALPPHLRFLEIAKSRLPVIGWLPRYRVGSILQDLLAGFTVGLTEIPQGIAYAAVAGLSPQYGLYSGFMGCFVYFLFGTCKDINIGPTAIMALMIQPFVLKLGWAGAVLMTFLAGCIILILGLLHLGFLVDFFSVPVIAGFTTAAALNIAASQLKSLLGISGKSQDFLGTLIEVFKNIKQTRLADTVLGVVTIICLIAVKELGAFGSLKNRPEWTRSRNIIGKIVFMISLARNAIAVIAATLAAYICIQKTGESPFKLTDAVDGGLPSFTLPPFSTSFNGTEYSFVDMASEYGAIIAFCPLIAILEHIAIAKAFSKGKALDATQELIALGICNIMGSMVQSMPVTGSFTRTAVNNASGVKTTGGGIITGLMVLFALGFLTSTFQYIPKATLAAVIIVAMFYLCKFKTFPFLWRTKKLDLIPLTVTLVCCLLISLEYGILIGIAVNITFVLYATARPKLDVEKLKFPQGDIYLIVPKTGLHFSSAEYLRDTILKNCIQSEVMIVIDGKAVGSIDATVAKAFHSLIKELEIRKQKIVYWNFKKSIMDICVGVSKDMCEYFKGGVNLEELVEPSPISRVTGDEV